ncbi:hypothetical protein MUK42_05771 [Musa troglodytarum]|uniref:Transmembrane protein n=1 Tax=Musa troglodytarum TaxID=320322 RepID=A0A9E7FZ28_9LILI|nr:hypothetical protein MUK42_05771 [Musa troglodytarum]
MIARHGRMGITVVERASNSWFSNKETTAVYLVMFVRNNRHPFLTKPLLVPIPTTTFPCSNPINEEEQQQQGIEARGRSSGGDRRVSARWIVILCSCSFGVGVLFADKCGSCFASGIGVMSKI